jgi:hypothetical protein
MFSGNLDQMPLAEVLRLLSMSHQTGALIIRHDSFSGSVFFQVGQLVHAASGALDGIDALTSLSAHRVGAFSFAEGMVAPTQSLVSYPTDKLIDKLSQKAAEQDALAQATLRPSDLPHYLAGKKVQGMVAAPDELTFLLMADGKRNVATIAGQSGRSVEDVGRIFGKFRQAGMIDVAAGSPVEVVPDAAPGAAPISEPEVPAIPAEEKPHETSKQPRYWRGKLIE